ncbi:MAG: hypothetical protein ACW98F_00060 [Candidatus Hodarchaeales archaeon]|jgi:hypothetical protein
MEKIFTPRGSRLNLEDVFELLQDAVGLNRENLEGTLFSSYGVLLSPSTALELTQVPAQQVVEVAAGKGITQGLHYIEVSENDPVADRRLAISDGFDDPVYIQYSGVQGDPEQILDGFVWTASGSQYRNTSQHDYYFLTIDDPGVSGFELANVQRSGAAITITDSRDDNRLWFDIKLLSSGVEAQLHYQNNDTGTTATDFKVGVGTYGLSAQGLNVLYEEDPPIKPWKPRIKDITYISNQHFAVAALEEYIVPSVRRGMANPKALVTFEWGYEYLEGTGGTGTFNIEAFDTSTGDEFKSVSGNELALYRLWVGGTDYIISGNNATAGGETLLTLWDLDGTPAGAIADGTPGSPAVLHSDADDGYFFEAIPYYSNALVYSQQTGGVTALPESPIKQTTAMELMLGWEYKFRVVAKQGVTTSNISWLQAGSYEKNGTNSYSNPFQVVLPPISMTGASVGLDATEFGFRVTIAGMASATDFEVVYTTDNAGADFENRNHPHIVTDDRVFDISTIGSQAYNVKVRPLQAGYVVSTGAVPYVENDIVSGAGGSSPNDKLLPFIYVDLYGKSIADANVVSSGAETTILNVSGAQDFIPDFLQGKGFIDSEAKKYEIIANDEIEITIREIDGGDDLDELAIGSVVYVGDTAYTESGTEFLEAMAQKVKRQRIVYQHTFPSDVIITAIDFDCDITDGTAQEPAVLRFYQHGNESLGKEVEIYQSDYFYYDQAIDLSILSSRGVRRLVVDAWDPAGVGNQKRMRGILTIHYRDKVIRSYTAVNYTTT